MAVSKTASLIFAEFHAHGPRTELQLVSVVGNERTSVQNALKAMNGRGHAVFKVVNGERVWNFGPDYAAIFDCAISAERHARRWHRFGPKRYVLNAETKSLRATLHGNADSAPLTESTTR